MTENNKYRSRMATLQLEDLFEISNFGVRDGYEADAIAAASDELASRNLNQSEVEYLSNSVESIRSHDAEKESENLAIGWQIILALTCMFIWTIAIPISLNARGYKKKSRDAWRAIGFGYLGLIGLAGLFVLSDIFA